MMRQSLFALLVLLLAVPFVQAQEGGGIPLVVTRYEDDAVYIVQDDELIPICQTGEPRAAKSLQRMDDIRSAPDGAQILFSTWANGTPDTNDFFELSEAFEMNYWLCDAREDQVSRLPRDPGVYMSMPVFAPDGTRLAWAQRADADAQAEVVLYDIASSETRIRSRFDADMLRNPFPALDWGQAGIVISHLENRGERQLEQIVIVTDPTATTDDQFFGYETPIEEAANPLRATWVEYKGEDWLWLQGLQGTQLSPSITSFLLATPDFEILEEVNGELRYVPQQVTGDVYYTVNSITIDDFSSTLPETTAFALSPDGQQMAYVTSDNFPYGGDLYVTDEVLAVLHPEERATPSLIGEAAQFNDPGVQAIHWGDPRQVIVAADVPTVELTRYVSNDEFQTLVPAEWTGDGNTFTRDEDTILVLGAGSDIPAEAIVQDVLGDLAEESGFLETPLGTWTLYTADYVRQGEQDALRVTLGVIEIEGWTFTVILQTRPVEDAYLYQRVFVPALSNFELGEMHPAVQGALVSDEETAISGTVSGTIDDCAFDGNCALIVQTNRGEINVIWAEGMMQCEGQYEDGITIGETVEAFGLARDASNLSICPSAEYYIRRLSGQ